MTSFNKREPQPKGKGDIVLDYVVDALMERAELGKEKYGTYLHANNGRNALVDALQESMDLTMYLAQAVMESIE